MSDDRPVQVRRREGCGRVRATTWPRAACLLPAGAAALLASCAATAPIAPESRTAGARVAIARGDVARADSELKLALQANPLDAEAHHMLGCILAQRGEREQALVGFQRAISIDPADAEAAYNTGTLLLLRGDAVPAARWLETAATIRPGAPRTYNNLAKAYFLSGLPELSFAAYEESLRIDPANETALRGLSSLADAAGLDREAASYRQRLEGIAAAAAQDPRPAAAAPGARGNPAPLAGGTPAVAPDHEVEALRAILRDLPHVTPERRGDRVALTGWTGGAKDREILGRVLAGRPDVLDLTTDDAGDPRRMIEVDATIFVVLELDSSSVGFNFLRLVNTSFSYLATQHAEPGTGFTAPGTTGLVTETGQQGWMFSASVDYDVNIANAADDRVAILARPHLTTLSGTPAKFLAGGEYVFRVAGNISGDIKPYPFGTTLTVTPTLLRTPGDDGAPRIHMSVEAGRTSVLSVLTATGVDGSTVFDKVQVSGEAVLGVGQTLILSGLSQRESRTGRSGVPVLRDIPLVKYLFSSTTTTESNSSVVILLTPRDPGYYDQRNRDALAEFVETRRAFVAAKQGGAEAMRAFVEKYPRWADIPPNRFASHFFLVKSSEIYRAVSGQDLTTETLDLGLLNSHGN
jgi:Tfp pilus assembly protein PilF